MEISIKISLTFKSVDFMHQTICFLQGNKNLANSHKVNYANKEKHNMSTNYKKNTIHVIHEFF